MYKHILIATDGSDLAIKTLALGKPDNARYDRLTREERQGRLVIVR